MKKIVALLLCVVMIVGVLSTTAMAAPTAQQVAVAAAFDTYAGVQEYNVALAVKKALASAAEGYYTKYTWIDLETGKEVPVEDYADALFAYFQSEFDFDGETFAAKDLKAFMSAVTDAYKATGTKFMLDLSSAMLNSFILDFTASGDADPEVLEWIYSMS